MKHDESAVAGEAVIVGAHGIESVLAVDQVTRFLARLPADCRDGIRILVTVCPTMRIMKAATTAHVLNTPTSTYRNKVCPREWPRHIPLPAGIFRKARRHR